jgi:hypothetical protein
MFSQFQVKIEETNRTVLLVHEYIVICCVTSAGYTQHSKYEFSPHFPSCRSPTTRIRVQPAQNALLVVKSFFVVLVQLRGRIT